jgi:NTP pyrophosphatase (non-canonical NTP hydrolase)
MDYERKVTEYLTPSEILAQMAEEGAELVQAALKLRRAIDKKNPTPKSVSECSDNLTEEFADVLVCLTVFAEAFDVDFDSLMDEIGDIGEAKMKRWAERLEEANKKRYLVNLGADGFPKETVLVVDAVSVDDASNRAKWVYHKHNPTVPMEKVQLEIEAVD